jgi:hypothetical protein
MDAPAWSFPLAFAPQRAHFPPMTETDVLASSLVSRFSRIVRRDGGQIRLIDANGDLIRLGYRPGTNLECKEGVCIMPEAELQAMIAEVLAAEAPHIKLQVVRDPD